MFRWLKNRQVDAETLLAKDEFERAIEVLEARIAAEPDDLAARRLLAEALERSGEKERAVDVLFLLTEALAASGQITRSVAVLKDVERLAPAPEIARRAGRLMRAAAEMRQAVPIGTSEIVLDSWADEAEEREDFLASPLFHGLDERELMLLFDELRLRRKHAGAVIYNAGQPAGGLYVLAQGTARLYRPVEDHRLEQAMVLREGDIFGLDAVLGQGRRLHTVTAADECEILEIDRAVFGQLAARHPEILARVRAVARERGTGH